MKGGKTRFQTKYSDEMFMNALTTDNFKSTMKVAEAVGCSRSTAKNTLDKLTREGKVMKFEIEGGSCGWQKVGRIVNKTIE
jgi:predicted transcriptional regulator